MALIRNWSSRTVCSGLEALGDRREEGTTHNVITRGVERGCTNRCDNIRRYRWWVLVKEVTHTASEGPGVAFPTDGRTMHELSFRVGFVKNLIRECRHVLRREVQIGIIVTVIILTSDEIGEEGIGPVTTLERDEHVAHDAWIANCSVKVVVTDVCNKVRAEHVDVTLERPVHGTLNSHRTEVEILLVANFEVDTALLLAVNVQGGSLNVVNLERRNRIR